MSVPVTRLKKDRPDTSTKKDDPSNFPVQPCPTSGELPGEIYGHSAVTWRDSMFVFGGCNQKANFSSDLFEYSFAKRKWKKLTTTGKGPVGRNFHGCCVIEDIMYIFGGKSNGYMNDLYSLDLETLTWSLETNLIGKTPTKRYGHSLVVHNRRMYVFGGYDDFGYKSNELWEYKPKSKEWKRIDTEGDIPERFHHSAVVHEGSMYVFGGLVGDNASSNNTVPSANWLFEYRFSTRRWSRVQTLGKSPDGRWGHSAVVLDNKLFIIGGCDNVLSCKDIYKLNLTKYQWTKVSSSGFEGRYFDTSVEYQQQIYIFGGRNIHNYCFNDLCIYVYDKWRQKRPDTYEDDMKSMLGDRQFADIVFEFPTEDGCPSIHAHRAILAARCANFKNMLTAGMKESLEGRISISDVRSTAYRRFLEYIYTNQLPLLRSMDEVMELLQLGDRYMLGHLKSLCERATKRYINLANLNDIWELAVNLQAHELQEFCVKAGVSYYEAIVDKKSLDKVLLSRIKASLPAV